MYATLQDLINRASEDEILMVADRDGDGVADAEVINDALVHADNAINGYLATRYRLPLIAVPDLINSWAVSIARYHLHSNGAPDHVVRDWKAAMSDLKDVARKLINLPIADGSEPKSGSGGAVSVTGPDPVFSKDKLGGWL